MKRTITIAMLFLGLAGSVPAQPGIKGYDPVAYFISGKAIQGKKEYSYTINGVMYAFSSAQNRDLFKASPVKYEPQYGGWCAYAMGAKGEKVEVDPETFKVLDGKLYLFYNKYFNNTLKSWNKDEANLKMKADANWAKINQRSEVFIVDGKAIRGYDPVAFFTESKAVKGRDSLHYTWRGADWFFSSRQNLERFKASPEKYAPQYGGYCAFGTAEGHKAPTQTETWTVVGDKLYFNYNMKVREMWVKDQPGFIRKADQNWPALKDKE